MRFAPVFFHRPVALRLFARHPLLDELNQIGLAHELGLFAATDQIRPLFQGINGFGLQRVEQRGNGLRFFRRGHCL